MKKLLDERWCNKCNETLPINSFNKDKTMTDGIKRICRDCMKLYWKDYYKKNKKKLNEKDQLYYRNNREGILDRTYKYSQTPKGREVMRKAALKQYITNPTHTKARLLLKDALKSGRIIKGPCNICGTNLNIEGHHTDYSKPYKVVWLCKIHHLLEEGKAPYKLNEAVDKLNTKIDKIKEELK